MVSLAIEEPSIDLDSGRVISSKSFESESVADPTQLGSSPDTEETGKLGLEFASSSTDKKWDELGVDEKRSFSPDVGGLLTMIELGGMDSRNLSAVFMLSDSVFNAELNEKFELSLKTLSSSDRKLWFDDEDELLSKSSVVVVFWLLALSDVKTTMVSDFRPGFAMDVLVS